MRACAALGALCLAASLRSGRADLYMHSFRGSNNRLNEQNVNRNNNNRLFDSQNNNKGGYSIGVDANDYEGANIPTPPQGPIVNNNPTAPVPITTSGPNNAGTASTQSINLGGTAGAGYQEPPQELEVGSVVPIEWTAQHACGPNDKTSCNVVIQYGCDVDTTELGAANAGGLAGVRDGQQTGCNNNGDQCPPLNNDEDVNGNTNDAQYGQHESVLFYQDCRDRERNKGLFTADQNVGNNNNARARKTRQNPNGGRSGTECAEERDYYPYWGPSPWRDIAVLTSNVSRCAYYAAESQNVKPKNFCQGNTNANNAAACAAGGGTWTTQPSWDATRAAKAAGNEPLVKCQEMFWSRDNHLGNGVDGQPNIYNWTVPKKVTSMRSNVNANAAEFDRCVLRVRYNITTGDGTDPAKQPPTQNLAASSLSYWDLDSASNGNDSPVHQDDPTNVPGATTATGGVDNAQATRTLQLALNTNQYGRTFEDRSLVFHLTDSDVARRRRRLQVNVQDGANRVDPNLNAKGVSTKYSEITDPDSQCDEIQELFIRGKRGNIVQSYPSVEHDFEPSPLVLETGDCIKMEFMLTDNDPPNNAGEGTPGTGRANFVLTETGDKNKPIVNYADQKALLGAEFFSSEAEMFRWAYLGQEAIKTDNGGAACLTENQIEDNNNEQNIRNCGKLNPVGPEYTAGYNKVSNTGTFHYMSTRENNFSNRSHKGKVVVVSGLGAAEIVGIVLGGGVGAAALGFAGVFLFRRSKKDAEKKQMHDAANA